MVTFPRSIPVFVLSRSRFALIFTLFLLFSATTVEAQRRRVLNLPNYDRQTIHFGFILGVNNFDFDYRPIADLRSVDSVLTIIPQGGTGFSLGIVSNLHLGDNLDLRFLPTLSFGERRLIYRINYIVQDSLIRRDKRVESTFLEFPLLLKFKSARHNNMRAYVIGGAKPVIDLASQDKVDDKGEKILKLKRNDLNWELGVGFDFYTQFFKFTPEFKMSFGLNNLLVQENNIYVNSVDRLRSKAFYISFLFE